MPITKSAKKAIRVSSRKKAVNDRRKGAMKEIMKKIEKLAKTDKAAAAKLVSSAFATIDKAAKGGIIKKNNAARKKARMARVTK
jgi:small subunit ribosomal protein S20